MDKIFKPDPIGWIDSQQLVPDEWGESLHHFIAPFGTKALQGKLEEFFAGSEMNSNGHISKMIKSTNPSRVDSFSKEDFLLSTSRALERVIQEGKGDQVLHDVKYSKSKKNRSKRQTCTSLSTSNLTLLTVEIYKPMAETRKISTSTRLPFPEQVFLLRSDETLTDLRDAITCVSELLPMGEFSHRPQATTVEGGTDSGSSFFYIEGIFCNDLRKNTSSDLSQVILEWAKRPSRGVGPFSTAVMDDVKAGSLKLRLGYPYVMVHQGNCEHLIVFTDLRRNFSISGESGNYPLLTTRRYTRSRNCRACKVHSSNWVVYDNIRLDKSPCFLCETCFLSFCYDSDSQPIGHFRAYPYLVM